MKTIPALICCLLIACTAYGQSDSTITISIETANRIQKQLHDYDIVKLQLNNLQEIRQQQLLKINALEMQQNQLSIKFDRAMGYAHKAEKAYKREKRKSTIYKIGIGAAAIVGFWLGSQ